MSDQSGWPSWAPPGDAKAGDADPGGPSRPADGAPASHASPPADGSPPPPAGSPQWSPPPPPGAASWPPPADPGAVYGGAGWEPPPKKRRTGLVVGIIIGVVLLALLLGGALLVGFRTADSGSDAGAGAPPDRPAPEDVPADEVDAQAEAILQTIDASEQRMIAYQEQVFRAIGEDGAVDEGAAAVARAASAAGDDLTGLRSDLQALGGGEGDAFDGLRDVRDRYTEHMDAWIEYVDAVSGTPTLASPQSQDAEPFWRDINTTGQSFVDAVVRGLPEDVPQEVQDLADLIVERGFGGYGEGGGNLV